MKYLTAFLTILLFAGWAPFPVESQPRLYIDKVYAANDISIMQDVIYAEIPPSGYWYDLLQDFSPLKQGRGFNSRLQEILDKKLRLDIYLPPAAGVTRPLLVVLHGGGFLAGNKKDKVATMICMDFARRGYVTASINYRHLGISNASFLKAGYTAIQDTRAAMRYLRNRADTLSIHPDYLFLAGESTGAVVTLHTAFLYPGSLGSDALFYDRKFGALDAIGEEGSNAPPRAVINISGGIIDTALLRNENIPIISFHGLNDAVVSPNYALPRQQLILEADDVFDWFKEKANSQLGLSLGRHPSRVMVEADIVDSLYGSAAIHKQLSGRSVRHTYHPFPGLGHHLMASRQGSPRQSAVTILNEAAAFLLEEIRDTVAIHGRAEVPARTRITYRAAYPAAAYHWQVEGGRIVSRQGAAIVVKWDPSYAKGKVMLTTTNELGAQSSLACLPTTIRRYGFEEWAEVVIDEDSWFFYYLIAGLASLCLLLIAWRIRARR